MLLAETVMPFAEALFECCETGLGLLMSDPESAQLLGRVLPAGQDQSTADHQKTLQATSMALEVCGGGGAQDDAPCSTLRNCRTAKSHGKIVETTVWLRPQMRSVPARVLAELFPIGLGSPPWFRAGR